ncbi:glycerol kinase GlpK [Demequina sp.]|uniref:glycerol kinase GlpK n=1 Tax=Demequina sp. TaxID=2050685 RepID=UPI003D0B4B94
MTTHVLAIDQGTTSTRAMIFSRDGSVVASAQKEHRQFTPHPGWVEHDPLEIWDNTRAVIAEALSAASLTHRDIAAAGITNQRETTIIWSRVTGEPVYPAIVWQDTRSQDIVDRLAQPDGVDRFRSTTGLPLATYFAGTKIAWILENVESARARAEAGELLFGTIDTWLLWNLTGGVDGGMHVTDVTNASRTLLMDLETLEWAPELLAAFDVPRALLPTIQSSSQVYGHASPRTMLDGVPIAGILGDQQAATFGQAAFDVGDTKCTYGTGNFVLVTTGERVVRSSHGLISTVGYKLGDAPAVYALEGSVAVTGSLVQWLRDNLGAITSAPDIERVAATVADNGGVYFVPAFSGLFAPYWRPDARGALVGLTHFANRGHLARAVLEATAYQTADVLEAVAADVGTRPSGLRVDGGMTANGLLMQFQADLLGIDVVRPRVPETTALGAAYAAGLAVGYWGSLDEVRANWREAERWSPTMRRDEAERLLRNWRKAVDKTLGWVDEDVR